MSKYAYHPPSRPPPADQSVVERIAAIGPIGICLETALDELIAEDNLICNDNDIDGRSNDIDEEITDVPDDRQNKKRKQPIEDSSDAAATKKPAAEQNEDASCKYASRNNANLIRIDESMSKSILESYSNAVATTKYDQGKKVHPGSSTPATAETTSAPAAMLQGEIDHYNRVGGQWRIVVKNAVLKPRSMKKIDNCMTGRSLRTRMVLDWVDDDNDNGSSDGAPCKESVAKAGDDDIGVNNTKKGPSEDGAAHHFKGTIQILAYDDT